VATTALNCVAPFGLLRCTRMFVRIVVARFDRVEDRCEAAAEADVGY
jgi:hypothetical protein